MGRTVQELRNRIANLEAQRDAIASAMCDKTMESDMWRECFKESIKIASQFERERDQFEMERDEAIARAERAEDLSLDEILDELDDEELDEDEEPAKPCVKCGKYDRYGCFCYDNYPDIARLVQGRGF